MTTRYEKAREVFGQAGARYLWSDEFSAGGSCCMLAMDGTLYFLQAHEEGNLSEVTIFRMDDFEGEQTWEGVAEVLSKRHPEQKERFLPDPVLVGEG